ncbi:MAG: hypothetical protein PHQ18_01780 [Patescibacteria group bacterium]|nr:hypothetical protein [Patescibacteria group bacterium]
MKINKTSKIILILSGMFILGVILLFFIFLVSQGLEEDEQQIKEVKTDEGLVFLITEGSWGISGGRHPEGAKVYNLYQEKILKENLIGKVYYRGTDDTRNELQFATPKSAGDLNTIATPYSYNLKTKEFKILE